MQFFLLFFFFVKTYCYFSAVTIEKYIFGILYCFLAFLEFVTNMLGVVKWSSYIEAKFLHSMFPGSMSSEAVSIPNRCPQNTGMWPIDVYSSLQAETPSTHTNSNSFFLFSSPTEQDKSLFMENIHKHTYISTYICTNWVPGLPCTLGIPPVTGLRHSAYPVSCPGFFHLSLLHKETLTCKYIPLTWPQLPAVGSYGLPSHGLLGSHQNQLADSLISLASSPDSQLPWYPAHRPLILLTVIQFYTHQQLYTDAHTVAHFAGTWAPVLWSSSSYWPCAPVLWSSSTYWPWDPLAHTLALRMELLTQQVEIETSENPGQTTVISRQVTFAPFPFLLSAPCQSTLILLLSFVSSLKSIISTADSWLTTQCSFFPAERGIPQRQSELRSYIVLQKHK